MTTTFRFTFLNISILTAISLSACQPATDNSEIENTVIVQADEDDEPVKDETDLETTKRLDDDDDLNDLLDDEQSATQMPSTAIAKEYNDLLVKMRDEMLIGINYNDPDTAFAKVVLALNRGTIEMAKIELKRGNDEHIGKLAQETMDQQSLTMDVLNKWLASHPDIANPKPETETMQNIYTDTLQAMLDGMQQASQDPIADMAFARSMVSYYKTIGDVAKVELRYGKDEEMRRLAQQMMNSALSQSELMQNWIATYDAEHPSHKQTLSPMTNEQ